MHGHRRLVTGCGSAIIDCCAKERALVEAGDIVGDEARGAEAMVENFHLNLAAVGVAGERKLDAQLRGTIKTIWIVRKKNIGHVAADERLDAAPRPLFFFSTNPKILIVQIEETTREIQSTRL